MTHRPPVDEGLLSVLNERIAQIGMETTPDQEATLAAPDNKVNLGTVAELILTSDDENEDDSKYQASVDRCQPPGKRRALSFSSTRSVATPRPASKRQKNTTVLV